LLCKEDKTLRVLSDVSVSSHFSAIISIYEKNILGSKKIKIVCIFAIELQNNIK